MNSLKIGLLTMLPLFNIAQAPNKFNFQSVLRNAAGVIQTDKQVSLKICILSGTSDGTAIYCETHFKKTDKAGLIHLQVGGGNGTSGSFGDIPWDNGPHFLQLEADLEGGSAFTLLGSQPLLSVPYALFANQADTVIHQKPETDPLFETSVAKGITQADTANWNRKTGNSVGAIQFWNGSAWINLQAGLPGQMLIISPSGIPSWETAPRTTLPTVTLTGLSRISPFSIDFTAEISSDGGSPITARGIVFGTQSDPTFINQTLGFGENAGSFEGTITALLPQTAYYVRAFATNDAGTRYSNQQMAITTLVASDVDGNTYPSIKIGSQIWFSTNLNVTKYQNMDNIDQLATNELWQGAAAGAWSFANNSAENENPYGKLYNWFAVSDMRKLCPEGWKIPSDEDWTILTDYLGGLDVAGGKLKATGISFWSIPNAWANNMSYFSALPGGYRDETGNFVGLGYYGLWWSATPNGENAWSRYLFNEFNYVSRENYPKHQGLSVRCLKE
jgi:uncharacterized protein (TIGR02145 family)